MQIQGEKKRRMAPSRRNACFLISKYECDATAGPAHTHGTFVGATGYESKKLMRAFMQGTVYQQASLIKDLPS